MNICFTFYYFVYFQHYISKKHKDKLNQKECEQMETNEPPYYPTILPPGQSYIKKSWVNTQSDVGLPYSYGGHSNATAGGGGGGYNVNTYTKWSGPSYQRSQLSYNHNHPHRY